MPSKQGADFVDKGLELLSVRAHVGHEEPADHADEERFGDRVHREKVFAEASDSVGKGEDSVSEREDQGGFGEVIRMKRKNECQHSPDDQAEEHRQGDLRGEKEYEAEVKVAVGEERSGGFRAHGEEHDDDHVADNRHPEHHPCKRSLRLELVDDGDCGRRRTCNENGTDDHRHSQFGEGAHILEEGQKACQAEHARRANKERCDREAGGYPRDTAESCPEIF